MLDYRINAPRRYFVDGLGQRVMIGLSLEETTEFEALDGLHVSAADDRSGERDGRSREMLEMRWSELYIKHDAAWRLWIAQSRAGSAESFKDS
ncbi:hypothetical protein [Bradyrhizobium sp. Gha]|uniref:hypothetical protein n=1 Tax=Bradyrhizobium sp. Gha TaxID=1855318 RepID=UPI0008E36BF6|nr:hypothetical protein [Bradyrhizobium sp. Gha]SFI09383.1 hypothetical protein SAMN05216525_10470 [Bradyrhizobium sp. Gha]